MAISPDSPWVVAQTHIGGVMISTIKTRYGDFETMAFWDGASGVDAVYSPDLGAALKFHHDAVDSYAAEPPVGCPI